MCFALVDTFDPSAAQPRRTASDDRARDRSSDGSGAEAPLRCGGCAASFAPAAWLALPLVAVLTGDAIATHVVKWPKGVRIAIRRCPRCGRSMARTIEP
jgi:hypothetical protein